MPPWRTPRTTRDVTSAVIESVMSGVIMFITADPIKLIATMFLPPEVSAMRPLGTCMHMYEYQNEPSTMPSET